MLRQKWEPKYIRICRNKLKPEGSAIQKKFITETVMHKAREIKDDSIGFSGKLSSKLTTQSKKWICRRTITMLYSEIRICV